MKEILLIWKYSLGSFSDSKTEKYDNWIALIRSVIFVSYMVTNCFIMAGVIRHWGTDRPVVRDYQDSNVLVSDPVRVEDTLVSDDTECIKK